MLSPRKESKTEEKNILLTPYKNGDVCKKYSKDEYIQRRTDSSNVQVVLFS